MPGAETCPEYFRKRTVGQKKHTADYSTKVRVLQHLIEPLGGREVLVIATNDWERLFRIKLH